MESETIPPNTSTDFMHSVLSPLKKCDPLFTSLLTVSKPPTITRIGFVFNARPDANMPTSDSVSLEYDEVETIHAIRFALEQGGFKVFLLEADNDFIEKVKASNIDFVFNIAEGIRGESRESHIPAILEMFGIPYTGSGVFTQALTLSKSRTKEILDYYKIHTARYQKFYAPKEKLNSNLKFPLIVKPDAEGSSVGITNASVVHSEKELRTQVEYILQTYTGPALVEEFCPGREFTVGVIGNSPPLVLPIIEVSFDHLPSSFEKIDSYESKWTYDTPELAADPLTCPAKISPKLQKSIEEIALKTYSVLGCVDLCRIDIRLNKKGIPTVLEVNALPGLNPNPEFHSRFPFACSVAGLSFDEMILAILHAGIKRYRL